MSSTCVVPRTSRTSLFHTELATLAMARHALRSLPSPSNTGCMKDMKVADTLVPAGRPS